MLKCTTASECLGSASTLLPGCMLGPRREGKVREGERERGDTEGFRERRKDNETGTDTHKHAQESLGDGSKLGKGTNGQQVRQSN